MISPETKSNLIAQGFYVEDMGKEHGPDFAGEYRWMNSATGDFQDFDTSDSEDDAWGDCARFYRNIGGGQ